MKSNYIVTKDPHYHSIPKMKQEPKWSKKWIIAFWIFALIEGAAAGCLSYAAENNNILFFGIGGVLICIGLAVLIVALFLN